MSKEAMKLALEALAVKFSEGWHEGIKIDASDIMLLNDAAQALAEDVPETNFGNTALDKMAENARELGLDYEPAQQQEPLFWYRPCSNGMYEGPIHNAQIERIRKESGAWHPLYTSPPAQQQEPVATDWERIARVQNAKLMAVCDESEGFKKLCEVMDRYERTSPPAQRTWVGLTDAETKHFWEISRAAIPRYHTFKILIEKALRERNT